MEKLIEKIKEIILENNYLDTLAGQRFKEWWGDSLNDVIAVIAFAGRSKERTGYKISVGSESDGDMYVTHLMLMRGGHVMVQLSSEDDDDFNAILPINMEPTVPIENFDEKYLREWIDLMTL